MGKDEIGTSEDAAALWFSSKCFSIFQNLLKIVQNQARFIRNKGSQFSFPGSLKCTWVIIENGFSTLQINQKSKISDLL